MHYGPSSRSREVSQKLHRTIGEFNALKSNYFSCPQSMRVTSQLEKSDSVSSRCLSGMLELIEKPTNYLSRRKLRCQGSDDVIDSSATLHIHSGVKADQAFLDRKQNPRHRLLLELHDDTHVISRRKLDEEVITLQRLLIGLEILKRNAQAPLNQRPEGRVRLLSGMPNFV